MKKRERFNIAVALTAVTQAGLSVLVPIGILVFFAKFLIEKFSFSDKMMLGAIVLGVLSGFYNMIKYIYMQINRKG